MIKYFDIHGHVNFSTFDDDREEVIRRAKQADIAMITVGTQIDTSKKALELARQHESMYATVGLHPIHTARSFHDVRELGESGQEFTSRGEMVDWDSYLNLAKNPKTVAIGECGLDYYHLNEELREKQVDTLETMIDLANEVKKPLMLHVRSGKERSAYRDICDIVRDHSHVPADIHFFVGSLEEAKLLLDLGCSFSFTGVITFAHDYDGIVRYIPLDRIMSETDCPYVSPYPYRGKRNEPAYVIEVVKTIAKIRGEKEEIVTEQLLANAKKFFNIS